MTDKDIEMKLLKGSPLLFENIPIHKITLGEMTDYKYGYSNLNKIINTIAMNEENAQELLVMTDAIKDNYTYSFIYILMIEDLIMMNKLYPNQDINLTIELLSLNEDQSNDYDVGLDTELNIEFNDMFYPFMLDYLKLLFKKEVIFDIDYGFIVDNKTVINELNFDSLRQIVKLRNCLIDIDKYVNDDNPADEFTRQLLEKRKKLQEKLKQAKKREVDEDDENDEITLSDLISIFAESEKMYLQDVYDNYDLYQFNNQFNRLKLMDDYHVNIQCLLAGAKDIKLKHYISRLPKKENNE